MGDPKFSRRLWARPKHPWDGERIKAENELLRKFGLKNKKELWKAESALRRFRQRARELQALVRYADPQAEKEKEELISRLVRLGILSLEQNTLDDVLSLTVDALLSRRLQTLVYVKGMAYTPRQARQLIVHGHVSVGERRVRIPGFLVPRGAEETIIYDGRSPLAHDLHPSRPKPELLQTRAIEAVEPEAKEGA